MKKCLLVVWLLMSSLLFAQNNNWELIFEQPGNKGILIENLSSDGYENDVFGIGRAKLSFNSHAALRVNQWTKDRNIGDDYVYPSIPSKKQPIDIFIYGKNIWVCGYQGLIASSKENGLSGSWEVQQTPGDDMWLTSIWFTDENNGWAVGKLGVMLYTQNGGQTWQKYSSPVGEMHFSRVFFTDSGNGYILGTQKLDNMGFLLKTTDAGMNWNTVKFNTNSSLNYGLFFTDKNNGWVCGSKGIIEHTSDGGRTWKTQQYFGSDRWDLNDICFVSPAEGWACGNRGELYYTDNGGNSWRKINTGETRDFKALEFNGPYLGWLATGRKIYQMKDPRFQYKSAEKYRAEQEKTTPTYHGQIPEKKVVKPDTPPDRHSKTVSYTTLGKGNSWELRKYDIHQIEQACKQLIKENKMAVGINIDNGKMALMYINKMPFHVSDFKLVKYTDISMISPGVTETMNSGFIPVGMSLADQQYYFLFAETNLNATAWQIVESELDHNAVESDIQSYLNDAYIPLAVSTLADQWFYTLLLQFDDFPATNWSIRGYEGIGSQQMQNEVNADIGRLFLPMGYLSVENIANVLYLKF